MVASDCQLHLNVGSVRCASFISKHERISKREQLQCLFIKDAHRTLSECKKIFSGGLYCRRFLGMMYRK